MRRLTTILSVLAVADAAVYGLAEDLSDLTKANAAECGLSEDPPDDAVDAVKPKANTAPANYKLPAKVRHMEGTPPGVDLSSLSINTNIIPPQKKPPPMPKINRHDGLGDDDPLPPLDKCDACFVLWRSLEGVLEAEPKMDKDRSDVLSGGRLDSGGAQTGTMHSYATSELRATRLIERVCQFVNAFRYNAQGAYWVRDRELVKAFEAGRTFNGPGHGSLPTHELRVGHVNYCATTVEDHEEELTTRLLAGGLDDAGRAVFCSVVRKDCRGDAVAEAAKRQGISDIISGINNDPPAAPAKKRRRRRKKKKKAVAGAGEL